MSSPVSQRGAALVTVLMIVAAMSIAALGLTQLMLAQTRRAQALDVQAQLRLYAVAAEETAEIQMAEYMRTTEGRLFHAIPGLGEVQTFPVQGGSVSVIAREATNCFNLNTLVQGIGRGNRNADEVEIETLTEILLAAEIDERDVDRMIGGLVDWMDSDLLARNYGAEDAYYAGLQPTYRTSGRPLANRSELRAIFGFTPELIAQIAPLTCVRPENAQPDSLKVNLNTLEEDQAPLLSALMSFELSVREARQLIASRPLGGWPSLDSFEAEPAIAKIAPEVRKVDKYGLVSTHIEVLAEVSYRGYSASMVYQYEILAGEPVRVIDRERVG